MSDTASAKSSRSWRGKKRQKPTAGEDDTQAGALNIASLRAAYEADDSEKLQLSLDGFSGPIDLLLELARDQKVDLAGVSIVQLADQYLLFIDHAQGLKIELAADYLVMASWLAYLKSCLLLPAPEIDEEDVSPHLMAQALRYRLQRLEAMRNAAADLMQQPQLGQQRLARGGEAELQEETNWRWTSSLYDLLGAYARMEIRRSGRLRLRINLPSLFSVDDAVEHLRRIFTEIPRGWRPMTALMPPMAANAEFLVRKSALASTFTALLNLCRDGAVELRQSGVFQPIYVQPSVEESRPERERFSVVVPDAPSEGQGAGQGAQQGTGLDTGQGAQQGTGLGTGQDTGLGTGQDTGQGVQHGTGLGTQQSTEPSKDEKEVL